jgi:BA14K-like protein
MRMRLHDYRFTDYRLAAYVVVAAVVAGGVAFGLDRAFAPAAKIEANGAPAAAASSEGVRQIPIARTSAADLGDPQGKLTPVYPAAPGKDMPVKDTPVVQAKPAAATTTAATATTSGSASASAPAPVAAAPAPVANAAPVAAASPAAAGSCNIAACAAAYRSFRESDCTYQPLSGARRICEGAPGAGGQIASQPPQSQSPAQPQQREAAQPRYDTRSTAAVGRTRYDDALRDAERAVRRLPGPGQRFEDDDDDRVVMEAPERRYDLRRNWVSEPQE